MRPSLIALTAAAALALASTVASADPVSVPVPPLPTPSIASANVTHVGTIPLDGVGVSMRTVKVGKQLRAFVSGAAGLSIYDASDPAHPSLLGHLPIYNWENEDIAVSRDGSTAILTEFDALFYLHVVDVSNPNLPVLKGTIALSAAHTVECADAHCNYLFGAEGETFDISDRAHPRQLPDAQSWGALTGAKGGHNVHQDAAGIWVSDTSPLVVFKETPDPLHLTVLTHGAISRNTAYQHNNIRPRANRFVPRKKGESLTGPLRNGELLLGEGETNFKATCSGGSGAFSTWSMVGFDRGVPMRQLDVLRPVSGTYSNGDPAVNGLGCSGHWFTQKDAKDGAILVAAAWYEHGTRFLKVDPRTGKIRQVGYYQPVRGSTSQTYWIPGTDYVWSIDYHSGIDILRFDQNAPAPTTAQLDASWLAKAHVVDTWSDLMKIVCRANGKATPTQMAGLGAGGASTSRRR
ncbi:MAG: hypothetical protein M3O32_02695 [Actinomycetota bacterium]|nr:hypothetical protein [Actinomycetota bacterium]